MRWPNSAVALPLVLTLAPQAAEAHDLRFAEEPTENFLQVGIETFGAELNTAARGEVPDRITGLGVELCFPTHGHQRTTLDYKPCIRSEVLLIPLDDKLSHVFDFARFELDLYQTDGWYIEWGVGVRAQDHRKAKMIGYNADLLLGWRSPSSEEGIGIFIAIGPTSTGLVSTKRIPKKLLEADADAELDLDGFDASGGLGAFFPEREAGIWNGVVVKVGYNFPGRKKD